MNPLPEISFDSVPPLSASERQRIIYQQQLTATYLQPRRHQLNYVQARQQMNSQQQQTNYQQQQQIYYHQLQMYQKQQQPTQLQPGQQQQLNYNLQQGQQQLNFQLPQLQRTKEEMKTLWVGGLQHWMDEAYLYYCFSYAGHVCAVRLIRNNQTGYSEGYGFVEFTSQAAAQRILLDYNGLSMPHTECQPFRLHWASSKIGQINFRPEAGPEDSLSEGNSATGVTDRGILQQTPQARPEDSLSEGDITRGVADLSMLPETPEAWQEDSLSEGDLAPGVTDRDRGMPQETPKAGPKFSLSASDLFGEGYPSELVKPEAKYALHTNSAIEQTTEDLASPFNQIFALPDICAEWRNDINENQMGGFGSFWTDVEFVRDKYER